MVNTCGSLMIISGSGYVEIKRVFMGKSLPIRPALLHCTVRYNYVCNIRVPIFIEFHSDGFGHHIKDSLHIGSGNP